MNGKKTWFWHTKPCVEHLATPGLQVCLPSGVMLLRVCDEQEVQSNIAGAQIVSGHLLSWWRIAWGLGTVTVKKGQVPEANRPAPAIFLMLCPHITCMAVGTHNRSSTGPQDGKEFEHCHSGTALLMSCCHQSRIYSRWGYWMSIEWSSCPYHALLMHCIQHLHTQG
jgi:hypothetical protein